MSIVPRSVAHVGDSPIDLVGEAEPLGSPHLSATVDFMLIAAGSAAILAPFVVLFASLNLRGGDPGLALPVGIAASVAIPVLAVARFGTPSDSVRAKAGLAPITVAVDTPVAPRWRRTVALFLDVSAWVTMGIALLTVPVGLSLVVIVSAPVMFPISIAAVGVAVSGYVTGRRPGALVRGPGLEVCGLRRVRTARGLRTVMASCLAAPEDVQAPLVPPALTLLWLAVSLLIVSYWMFCVIMWAVGSLLNRLG
ncbi:MAG: hypothetical protein Q7W16_02715 [Coriobacteriia bacterium]|nr:hypothetical protein [Coriobacteriia bacterium]